MYYRRLSTRGFTLAVTIPKKLRDMAGIGHGDTVAIYAADKDTIVIKKVDPFNRRTNNGK